jgi:UDP-N-acetylmuramoyl-tripeptide--D-alanyl-D-alanine ligase
VIIDSRGARPGALFFALPGERGDGHEFVADAFERGAEAAVVHREVESPGPTVMVADTEQALSDLAAHERGALRATVIGITGSTGKTITKDLTAAILGSRFDVVASAASFNNEIGLPLTVLEAEPRTEVLVCEMGSRGIGHIEKLCRVARPDIGVVTNVGEAHMDLFGSRENIARAKGELVECLPESGTAVLNADDQVVRGYAGRTAARILTFGTARDADVRADDIDLDEEGRARFKLAAGGEREHVELSTPGGHMVENALAAAACGVALGLSAAECAAALKGARISRWRMETFTTPQGIRVVNDAYNANPTSVAAALKSARWMSRGGRCIAVLGHMAELGPISDEEHARVGGLVARLGFDALVTVGPDAVPIAHAAVREGLHPNELTICETPAEALDAVRRLARRGDVVLVKASRIARLEQIAEGLAGEGA